MALTVIMFGVKIFSISMVNLIGNHSFVAVDINSTYLFPCIRHLLLSKNQMIKILVSLCVLMEACSLLPPLNYSCGTIDKNHACLFTKIFHKLHVSPTFDLLIIDCCLNLS